MADSRCVKPTTMEIQITPQFQVKVDGMAKTARERTDKIHVAYLFENEGIKILRVLSLALATDRDENSKSNWKIFAHHLGMGYETIRYIDVRIRGMESPVKHVLEIYAQQENAYLANVISILMELEREDLIRRIYDDVLKLADYVSSKDPESRTVIPRPRVSFPLGQAYSPVKEVCRIKGNQPSNTDKKQFRPKYIVMLTFADDAVKVVERITKIFKSRKIGVVILEEQREQVQGNGLDFIEKCIKQVNVVIPILTKGYLNEINNSNEAIELNSSLDHKYAKFIYKCYMGEYLADFCKNMRIRPVLPDDESRCSVRELNIALSTAWLPEAKINELLQCSLLKKQR